MQMSSNRLLSRLMFGLLVLTQAECFAQAQNGAANPAEKSKLVADQNSVSKWDFKSRSPAVLKIERALQESTNVDFTDLPLEEGLIYLAEFHHIVIRIDKKELAEEGISVDQPVTMALSEVSLGKALRLMLDPLDLDYVVKNDVLLITTEEEAQENFENRVYDTSRLPNLTPTELKEIITKIVSPSGWKAETPNQLPGGPNNLFSALGGGVLPDPTGAPNAAQASDEADSPRGNICAVGNTLIIRQTYRIHEEIVDLLEQLEKQQNASNKKKHENQREQRGG